MSKKMNSKRAAYQKKQEEQGKRVVRWIAGILLLLAVAYFVWTLSMM